LETIHGYTGNLGEQTKQKRARAASAHKKAEADTRDAVTDADKTAITHDANGHEIMLQRGKYLYRNWGIQMLREVLLYCVPSITKGQANGLKNVDIAKEVVEFAWDLRMCEDNASFDGVASTSKRVVWENLAKQYIQKGMRLDNLLHCLREGYVNWSVHGHYDLGVVDAASRATVKVAVTHKMLNRTRYVPEGLLQQDDFRGCEIRSSYSQASAYLWVSSGETSLFPGLMQKLAKQASDPPTPMASSFLGGHLQRQRSVFWQSSSLETTNAGSVLMLPPLEQVLQMDAQRVQGQQTRVEKAAAAEERGGEGERSSPSLWNE